MPHDEPDADPDASPPGFGLLVTPGVNPAKWLRVWEQRLPGVPLRLVGATTAEQEAVLGRGDADAGLVRLPVDRDHLSAIPLYTETTVVVVPIDHVITAADEVTPADLADETVLVPQDDVLPWPDRPGATSALAAPSTTAEAVELVAAGVGVLVVPQSLARLHHRRDLTYRPLLDAPTSTVALAWVTDAQTDLVEELIGIVRGRTVNSSRGRAAAVGQRAGDRAASDGPEPSPRAGRPGGEGRAGGTGRARGAAGARRTSRRGGGRPGRGRTG
ncbi:LysR substrate-binding domain-containing protein [uncultured Cellulomonas sp.]|uniref:LysR substrate-binding domain-containing protein n=1 Tax=uncultured Cellulomonas sp. TaxID=189682 RepID=UPI002609D4CA|nr:LysR substrate-binding domain-containing protein [uncultured Cellulomonas sp.]